MKTPYFINIDFELKSFLDLSDLCSEMGGRISVMVNEQINGEFQLNFECVGNEEMNGLVSIMEEFFKVLDTLSEDAKKILRQCTSRVADIGFNSGQEGWFYDHLPVHILSKLVNYGFSLKFSIYGFEISSNN